MGRSRNDRTEIPVVRFAVSCNSSPSKQQSHNKLSTIKQLLWIFQPEYDEPPGTHHPGSTITGTRPTPSSSPLFPEMY